MAGSRVYRIGGDNITVVGSPTLVFMNPSTTIGFEILRCEITQRANTTSAQQGVALQTQPTSFPTLVSATPTKMNLSDPTANLTGNTTGAAGTCGINASAEGAGTPVVLFSSNFNVLNGWLWIPTPSETIAINANAAQGFGMKFTSTPGTLTGWSWNVIYRELG